MIVVSFKDTLLIVALIAMVNPFIVFSVQTFVVKLATGLSLGVIGIGLTVIKFVTPVETSPDVFNP